MQIHISKQDTITPTPVKENERLHHVNKPSKGLWTSTACRPHGEWTSDWWEFIKTNHLVRRAKYVHMFTIVGSPRILSVNRVSEIDDVYAKWGHDGLRSTWRETDMLDWVQIAHHFDAFYISKAVAQTTQFRTWDCESFVWFDPTYLKKQFTWKISKK